MDLKPLLEFIKDIGAPVMLGALIIPAMWDLDSIIKPESRRELARSSESFWKFEIHKFEFFKRLFDLVYDTKKYLRPAIPRFLFVGMITIISVGILLTIYNPRLTMIFIDNAKNYDLRGYIGFILVLNILFDYFSIWKSRILLSFSAGSVVVKIAIMFVDVTLTLTIYSCGWFIFQNIITFLDDSGGKISISIETIRFRIVYSFLEFSRAWSYYITGHYYLAYLQNEDSVFPIVLTTICSMVAPIWVILYISSLMMTAIIQRIARILNPIISHLDFESNPLRINGIITGSLLICGGTIYSIIQKML